MGELRELYRIHKKKVASGGKWGYNPTWLQEQILEGVKEAGGDVVAVEEQLRTLSEGQPQDEGGQPQLQVLPAGVPIWDPSLASPDGPSTGRETKRAIYP